MNKIILFLFIAKVYAQESVGSDAEIGYAGKKVELTVDLGKVTDPAADLSVSLKPVVNFLNTVKLDTLLTELIKDVTELTGKIKNKVKDKQLEEVIKSMKSKTKTAKTKKEMEKKFKKYIDDILLTHSGVEKKVNELKGNVISKLKEPKVKDIVQLNLTRVAMEALSINAKRQLLNVLQDTLMTVCLDSRLCIELNTLRGSMKYFSQAQLDLVKSLNDLLSELSDNFLPEQIKKLNVVSLAKLQSKALTNALAQILYSKVYLSQYRSLKTEYNIAEETLKELIKRGADDKYKSLEGVVKQIRNLINRGFKDPYDLNLDNQFI